MTNDEILLFALDIVKKLSKSQAKVLRYFVQHKMFEGRIVSYQVKYMASQINRATQGNS